MKVQFHHNTIPILWANTHQLYLQDIAYFECGRKFLTQNKRDFFSERFSFLSFLIDIIILTGGGYTKKNRFLPDLTVLFLRSLYTSFID